MSDSTRLLVCYLACLKVPKTIEKPFVSIFLGFEGFFSYIDPSNISFIDTLHKAPLQNRISTNEGEKSAGYQGQKAKVLKSTKAIVSSTKAGKMMR